MRYWRVNQKPTYRHEVPGGYLSSPKRKANGARNPFYDGENGFDLTLPECNLLRKVLDSYLSELRTDIAATKRATGSMHAEENLIIELQRRLAQAT